MFNSDGPSLSDIAAVTGGGQGSGWGGGDGWWALIILFALFGGWGNGNGWGGNGSSNIPENFALQTDMASIERRIDGIDEHLCNGDLSNAQYMASNFAAVQQALTSGFDNLGTAVVQNGYESRLATNALQSQMQQCCCDTRQAIADNASQGLQNTNLLASQLQQNRYDDQMATMQTRFEAQQNQCATLQAIEAVGDRIANKMDADRMQQLRDENQALRFAASQAAQNQYLTNELRPAPVPAYAVPNPYAYSGGCNCGFAA